jgi:hypothetical protein
MPEDMVVDTASQILSAAQKGKGKMEMNNGRQVKGGPSVEKYRPTSLADVAAHKDIIDTSTLTCPVRLILPNLAFSFSVQ